MEKIFVTLLLVIVAVAAFIGIEDWHNKNRNNLINTSDDKVNVVLTENQ